MSIGLSFQLLKYSHATGEIGADIPWIHLSTNDLAVVVGGGDRKESPLTMRILQGTETLEHLDIAAYVDYATRTQLQAEHMGNRVDIPQLPIFGITKASKLALRYRPDHHKQNRRVQLQFCSPSECMQVTSVFTQRGMQFQTQRPRTALPGTSSGRMETPGSIIPLSTPQANSPPFGSSSPFRLPDMEAGSLSRRPATSAESSLSAQHISSTTRGMPPPRIVARDDTKDSPERLPARPSSTQLERHVVQPSQPTFTDTYDSSRYLGDRITQRPFSASHAAVLETPRHAAADKDAASKTAYDVSLPNHLQGRSWPASCNEISFGVSDHGPHTSTSSATTMMLGSPQPTTAASPPFKRPESRRSDASSSANRPGSSTLDLPPLQKPKLVREKSAASKSVQVQPPTQVSGRNSPFLPTTATPAPTLLGHFTHAKSISASTPSLPTDAATTVNTALHESIPISDISSRSLASSGGFPDAKRPRLSSLLDAPHEIESSPPVATKTAGAAFESSSSTMQIDGTTDGSIGRAYAAIQPSSSHSEAGNLTHYAMHTEEDRRTAMEQFMMENLGNPTFKMLCEDVENCWRRIALGL